MIFLKQYSTVCIGLHQFNTALYGNPYNTYPVCLMYSTRINTNSYPCK